MTRTEIRLRGALDAVARTAVPEGEPVPTAPRPQRSRAHRARQVWIASGVIAAAAVVATTIALTVPDDGSRPTNAANQEQWQRFSTDGVSFDYPSAWRAYPYDDASTMTVGVTFLSSKPIPEPCSRPTDPGRIDKTCITNPVPTLGANDVFVTWMTYSNLGGIIADAPGTPTTLAGRSARIDRSPDPDVCRRRADHAEVASVGFVASGILTMTACFGPDPTGANLAAVDRMLRSLTLSN